MLQKFFFGIDDDGGTNLFFPTNKMNFSVRSVKMIQMSMRPGHEIVSGKADCAYLFPGKGSEQVFTGDAKQTYSVSETIKKNVGDSVLNTDKQLGPTVWEQYTLEEPISISYTYNIYLDRSADLLGHIYVKPLFIFLLSYSGNKDGTEKGGCCARVYVHFLVKGLNGGLHLKNGTGNSSDPFYFTIFDENGLPKVYSSDLSPLTQAFYYGVSVQKKVTAGITTSSYAGHVYYKDSFSNIEFTNLSSPSTYIHF